MAHARAVSVQLSIKAPKGTPAHIIKEAIRHKCETLEDTPGIEIEIVDWRGRNGRAFDQDQAWGNLRKPIERAYLSLHTDRKS